MGASVLPVAIHDNKLYFLFGKERDIDENPGWSDFGGGTDKGETFLETAIREGGEELTGFLGSSSDIRSMLSKYGTYNIDYKSEGYSTYRCHIFPMEYDSKLVQYYNNNQVFLQKRLDKKIIRDTKIFEKTQIKWFSFDDMKKNQNQFRSFYRNIVALILAHRPGIEAFMTRTHKHIYNKMTKRHRTHKRTYNKRTKRHRTHKRKI
jgi:hypothetical protein